MRTAPTIRPKNLFTRLVVLALLGAGCTEPEEGPHEPAAEEITTQLPNGHFGRPVLHQSVWRGGSLYWRQVPFAPGVNKPDWGRATSWTSSNTSALPGSGTVQTWDVYDLRNEFVESYWRNNQGYSRTVPKNSAGGPDPSRASVWGGPYAISALPGSGSMQSQHSIRTPNGGTLVQSFWRGNQGFSRSTPIDATTGKPNWSASGPWSGPFAATALPGSGTIQSTDEYISPNKRNLVQAVWRGSLSYIRDVPIDASGNIVWAQAGAWSAPAAATGLPGSGDIQASDGFIFEILPEAHAMPLRAMVVIYNPIIESRGGQRLSQVMGWRDPRALTTEIISDLKRSSGNVLRYAVVETVERDEWPIHTNGRRYTDDLYLQQTAQRNWTLGPGDYNAIIRDLGIEGKVNAGTVDEVFLWGGPGFGWWESAMAGKGAYWINGGPIRDVNSRAFVLMGLNYEREVAAALESFGHRTESIMKAIYGSWEAADTHDWNKFALLDRDVPGKGGIGNAHNAFNAEPGTDYNRASMRTVLTSADDWLKFPNMTGTRTMKNCTAWGCEAQGYLNWWYAHMPRVTGTKNGVLNNWWRYIGDPSHYLDLRRIVTSPQTEFTENNAGSWACAAEQATCSITTDTSRKFRGGSSIRFDTNGGFDTWVRYPAAGNANWNLSTMDTFSFVAYATNNNASGFQGQTPVVYLKNANGAWFRYTPAWEVLNQARGLWTRFVVPLAGGNGWTRTSSGAPSLADIDQVEIHADTWGGGFTIHFDNLGFSRSTQSDGLSPATSITSPANQATVAGWAAVKGVAIDDNAVFRVDLYIDGRYSSSDVTAPYTLWWDTRLAPNGTHTVALQAIDHAGNGSPVSSVTVQVAN